ncbi:MAG TPA: hypothetical protein VH637_14695 [Streptosporangiaceae bacterium]|jgi:hypothetical protein
MLLLPVRIETRFAGTGDGSELLVRIYPDQIMVNAHHQELTTAELAAGSAYWDAVWRAGNPPQDPDAARAPWRGLASRYGAPRAAWIVRQSTPVNIGQRPAAPTPDGQDPVPAPQPPSPPAAGSSWDQPARAALLPAAWTVVLDDGATSVSHTGSPVTAGLALSPSPASSSLAGGFPDGLPVDDEMRWLVDFDAAVAAGMAMRIPITPAQRQAGFDRVLVYGLSAEAAGPAAVAALLDAHHYSDGLAFVPQGAPTSNTADAPSAWSRADPGELISFGTELGPPLTAQPDADGPVAASLLGVPVSTFDHVRFADRHDMRDGQDMLTALWPATLGYFLRQLSDGGLTEERIEQARGWTIAHVRPRGPLPALSAGQVPYGILPVTSTELWQPDTADQTEAAVLQLARRLRPAWTASAAAAPRLGATPGDPDADLAHVLGMDASSMSFRGRHVLGDQLLWNLMGFLAEPAAGRALWWQQHLVPGRAQLDALGYASWDPRVIHAGLSPADFPVSTPTVTDGPLSETAQLPADASLGGAAVNYISWLRHAAVDDIRAGNYPGPAVPGALLYQILRQSVLLEYLTLAQSAQVVSGELTLAQTREQELVGIEQAAAGAAAAAPAAAAAAQVTPWQVLARPVSAAEPVSWAEYLVALEPEPGSPFERLAELRASLDRLAALPTAELDRLLTETLDACSHRLDVWVTALATARLARQRADGDAAGGRGTGDGQGRGPAGGLLAGGYGFVANLRPAAAPAPAGPAAARLVAGLDTRRARQFPGAPRPAPPLQAAPDNGGFVHAPSMAQAGAAAVLRSGYLSHADGAQQDLLALDLSSDRVRAALYLLDGVRQGQPLGALLGYQLETGMHAAGLDTYIQPLRDRFPVATGKLTPASPADEAAGASNVVDVLALDRARQAGTLAPGADWGAGLPGPGPDQDTLLTLFAAADDMTDAISDVGVAEAVYQTMRGNPGRAGGTLDGLSQAQQMPDPQVVATPRGGADHTQRVCALLAGTPARHPDWAPVPLTPRALAEPWLDAWVSALLPGPAGIEATVTYTAGAAAPVTATVRLSDLGAGPLDVLAMSRVDARAQRSELDDRVIYAAVPAGATGISVSYPDASPPAAGFADLLSLARAIADLVAGSRALAPDDLAPPDATAPSGPGPAGVDVTELNTRAGAARTAIAALVTQLAIAAAGTSTPDEARDAIAAASGYGLAGAVPPSRRGSGPDPRLAAQAGLLHDALAATAASLAAITLQPADPAPALELLDTAFGKSLLVLPRFTPPDPSLGPALAADPALIGADPVAVERWRQQLTHVRAGVSRLDLALLLAELVAGAAPPAARIAQLPAVPGDRWLALPPGPGAAQPPGRVAVMALVTGDVTDPGSSWAGLLVDSWPERVPSGTQTAAVAFHYDEPAARAPQAMLLAACPDLRRGWDDATLAQVLRETLDLAGVRAVDLSSLGEAGQLLPALYFPFNLEEDTVSAVFAPFTIVTRQRED